MYCWNELKYPAIEISTSCLNDWTNDVKVLCEWVKSSTAFCTFEIDVETMSKSDVLVSLKSARSSSIDESEVLSVASERRCSSLYISHWALELSNLGKELVNGHSLEISYRFRFQVSLTRPPPLVVDWTDHP